MTYCSEVRSPRKTSWHGGPGTAELPRRRTEVWLGREGGGLSRSLKAKKEVGNRPSVEEGQQTPAGKKKMRAVALAVRPASAAKPLKRWMFLMSDEGSRKLSLAQFRLTEPELCRRERRPNLEPAFQCSLVTEGQLCRHKSRLNLELVFQCSLVTERHY